MILDFVSFKKTKEIYSIIQKCLKEEKVFCENIFSFLHNESTEPSSPIPLISPQMEEVVHASIDLHFLPNIFLALVILYCFFCIMVSYKCYCHCIAVTAIKV